MHQTILGTSATTYQMMEPHKGGQTMYTHRECVHAGQAMHAIISFTSAYAKIGHLSIHNIVCWYQCAQLSQLMRNPLGSNPCWVIISFMQWHALSMCMQRSLWAKVVSYKCEEDPSPFPFPLPFPFDSAMP